MDFAAEHRDEHEGTCEGGERGGGEAEEGMEGREGREGREVRTPLKKRRWQFLTCFSRSGITRINRDIIFAASLYL
jgi:hypothetical protein